MIGARSAHAVRPPRTGRSRASCSPLASAGIRAGRLPGRGLPTRRWRAVASWAAWACALGARHAGGVPLRGQHRPGGRAASCFPFNCARRRAGASTERGAYDSTACHWPEGPADRARIRSGSIRQPMHCAAANWFAIIRPTSRARPGLPAAGRIPTSACPARTGLRKAIEEGGGARCVSVPAGPPSRLDAPARDAYTRTRFGARARLPGARS